MFDINKFANDLAGYVTAGILTKENAETVFEAACNKYGLDPETGEPIVEASAEEEHDDFDDITLEEAYDILYALEEEEAKKEDEKKDTEEEKKEEKDFVKALAIGAVAAAAVGGTGAVILTQTEKGRAKMFAHYAKQGRQLKKDYDAGKISRETYIAKRKPITAKCKKLQTENGFLTRLNMAAKAGVAASKQTPSAQKITQRKNDKLLNKAMKDLENGKISNIELDEIYKKVKDNSVKHGIKVNNDNYSYNAESTLDLINDYLNDRIMEACAECDPTKNVENEIDEKLPVITPNEDEMPADDPSIEKTDKAIEDAKRYLDVASKLAEMKAAHEAEKDTTQQHEVIKQALESEDVDMISLTKLNIYEAADAGILSDDEKYELLSILDE